MEQARGAREVRQRPSLWQVDELDPAQVGHVVELRDVLERQHVRQHKAAEVRDAAQRRELAKIVVHSDVQVRQVRHIAEQVGVDAHQVREQLLAFEMPVQGRITLTPFGL